jgi:hypothetical protein
MFGRVQPVQLRMVGMLHLLARKIIRRTRSLWLMRAEILGLIILRRLELEVGHFVVTLQGGVSRIRKRTVVSLTL